MITGTSLDNLYDAYGALVLSVTGRQWWRKAGIQARPKLPYATIFFAQVDSNQQQIVENVEDDYESGKPFAQIPWGISQVQAQFEFYMDRPGNTVQQAANRLRQALYLEERFWDVWQISSLSGGVQTFDLSLAFREDIEPRTEVRFMLNVNLVDPLPLPDTEIWDIHSNEIKVLHNGIDNVITEVDVAINDDES
jgi:hypothetical protein